MLILDALLRVSQLARVSSARMEKGVKDAVVPFVQLEMNETARQGSKIALSLQKTALQDTEGFGVGTPYFL
jgi:hypothetical protein